MKRASVSLPGTPLAVRHLAVVALAVILTSAVCLVGCGSESGGGGGGLLGKLPSIAKKTMQQMEGAQKAMEKAEQKMDVNAYGKAEEKVKEIEKKAEAEAKSAIEATKGIEIPFEQEADKDKFLIKNIKVTGANFWDDGSRMDIEATFEAVADNKRGTLFAYLRFIDKDGKEIEGWAILMTMASRNKPIKSGETYTMKGSYDGIERLANVGKVVAKTREEWDSKKSE